MQVKRYIDVYSNSSVVGFSSDDMSRISDLYSAAEQNWSNSVKHILMDKNGDEGSTDISALLKEQIAAYLNFFSSVVELARSKWTEFNLNLMITGFGILVISLILQFLAVFHGDKSYAMGSWLSTAAAFSLFIVTIRACSFLSNSYICKFQVNLRLSFLLFFLCANREIFCQQWKKGKLQTFFWQQLDLSSCGTLL